MRTSLWLAIATAGFAWYLDHQGRRKLDPWPWPEVPLPPELHGLLARNELLINAEHLHFNETVGPEAFALREDGRVYTGLAGNAVY